MTNKTIIKVEDEVISKKVSGPSVSRTRQFYRTKDHVEMVLAAMKSLTIRGTYAVSASEVSSFIGKEHYGLNSGNVKNILETLSRNGRVQKWIKDEIKSASKVFALYSILR